MNQKEKFEVLNTYIKENIAPILVYDVETSVFDKNAVIIPSDIDISELNGHYEGIDFVPPTWFKNLENSKDFNLLIIDNLSKIEKDEQTKFIEILKYKKVGVFDLPKNCRIIITCEKLSNSINDEIISLVAVI